MVGVGSAVVCPPFPHFTGESNMSFRNCLTSSLCILALFISASALAQDRQLSDATTFADVVAYIQQEMGKHNARDHGAKENARVLAGILLPASEKLLGIAENDMERRSAFSMKLTALQNQITAEIEDAEQRFETFLNEVATHEDASVRNLEQAFRFNQFSQRITRTAANPEELDGIKAEFKTWLNQGNQPAASIASLGLQIAERNRIPAEQFVRELTTFIQSPECTLPEERKRELVVTFEGLLRLAVGNDPKLYGRTLDDKEFEWEKLRGKYVLIKFTATWCGPCEMQIPSMLEAYERYHEKGFEIVSVYMWQRDADPVATVKNYVEEKGMPWIIISEELSRQAGHPEFGSFYNIRGVPTMVLVDKEGKIIMTNARGPQLQSRLAEIFR